MKIRRLIILNLFIWTLLSAAHGQTGPLLTRTTYKTDQFDFGVGGLVSVAGAPQGSVTIEGWENREIEISAEIEVQAANEADLALLSEITTFATEESIGRTGILSLGVNDKQYLKRLGKKVSKTLAAMPFRIDYVVRVPRYCDIQVDGGVGELKISGVEGSLKLNYLDTNARLDLVGGSTAATFGKGTVEINVPSANWRGRFVDIQLASGTMQVNLPPAINAEFDAAVLRTGKIENAFSGFKPRVRKAEFTDRSIVAKSGVGGITMKFTVGDGTLRIAETPRAKLAEVRP